MYDTAKLETQSVHIKAFSVVILASCNLCANPSARKLNLFPAKGLPSKTLTSLITCFCPQETSLLIPKGILLYFPYLNLFY